MISKIKNIVIIILIFLTLYWFYKINNINYKKYSDIKLNTVKHPEYLPTKQIDKISSFWFSNIKADLYWLSAIQYIWSNAVSSEYKKYLYKMIDLITDLNPYFEHPYIVWELLLPSYNYRYENLSEKQKNKYIDEAINIWLKWVDNYCNKEKIEDIKNEYNLYKLWTDPKYKDPCKSHMIPYYLAYIYFYYKNDWLEAAKYYKISSANTSSLEWSKVLSAIMQWKWWDREKSIMMFLNLAKNMDNDEVCISFSNYLEKIMLWVFNKQIILDWEIIKAIENTRKDFLIKSEEENNLDDTKCKNYALKATREVNLYYIENANNNFTKDKWVNSIDAKDLQKYWYIDFLPIDYQQQDDYWIIYYYNSDSKKYDYKMWEYQ